MKKSILKICLFFLLVLGSISSSIFLNSSKTRLKTTTNSLPNAPNAESEKENRDLVLPDVTVLQKIIDLVSKLVAR